MSETFTRGRDTARMIGEAALRLFARKGYAAVAMREIAEEAGLRQGGIYNHFAGKQEILRALMVGHMERLLEAWERRADVGGDPAARLGAFTRFHIAYHFARPDAVFVAYMELRNLEPDNFAAVEALRGRYEAVLRSILRDGASDGGFSVRDPAVEARALIAMLTGITTWYRDDGPLSIAEIEEIYAALVRRAVGPPDA